MFLFVWGLSFFFFRLHNSLFLDKMGYYIYTHTDKVYTTTCSTTSKGHGILVLRFCISRTKAIYTQKMGKHHRLPKCFVIDVSFLLVHPRDYTMALFWHRYDTKY